MFLQYLEINGFKSFAKTTTLEFPVAISAIVGPNGSGKSNIAEALRWVLGEQSMKQLRSHRGEDLIFNGAANTARFNKACVALVFDNAERHFPLPYQEITIGRCVWRDGTSEYSINQSPARLKDVLELLAHIGLGASQHHIIGQGEADRMLHASPRERQNMIEEALGLRVYQLKRYEAERKLAHAQRNQDETEHLQREIRPHLKFLKRQAEKYAQTDHMRTELQERFQTYFSWFAARVREERSDMITRKSKPREALTVAETRIADARQTLQQAERNVGVSPAFKEIEKELAHIQTRRLELERERGRQEGLAEARQGWIDDAPRISESAVEEFLGAVEQHIKNAQGRSLFEEVQQVLKSLRAVAEQFRKRVFPARKEDQAAIEPELTRIDAELKTLFDEECAVLSERRELQQKQELQLTHARATERALHQHELQRRAVEEELHALALEEERLRQREEEYEREWQDVKRFVNIEPSATVAVALEEAEVSRLRREIERLKVKLEEAGGMDPNIIKEYEQLQERDEFFISQLEDLEKSITALRVMIKDLNVQLEEKFKKGIGDINKAFTAYFSDMFNGGSAALKVITPARRTAEETKDADADIMEEAPAEEGLDIEVSIPRKRIRSLAALSGGERALTSIALLFAVSRVNPPPFLVLDETDAALDEANSRRYGKLLEELSKKTQVIVITHNRETMKHAQVLYGVTMGRDAASALLSVKFEEATAMAGA